MTSILCKASKHQFHGLKTSFGGKEVDKGGVNRILGLTRFAGDKLRMYLNNGITSVHIFISLIKIYRLVYNILL